MPGLNEKDFEILRKYAKDGNRELYFNYLASKEGNDGYGLLALGVVRNDNAPGATANHFAQNQALRDGKRYGEREWQAFGVELIRNDLALREAQYKADRPDLALNLPVLDVQNSHDKAFRRRDIDPDAWTPRQLIEAARRHGGEPEAEKVWSMMLDNQARGLARFFVTSENLAHRYNDQKLNASSYFADMGVARSAAFSAVPNTDPNTIRLDGKEYSYHAASDSWQGPAPIESRIMVKFNISDPAIIERLNDARDVRLERDQLRTQFHPDDPNLGKSIKQSPALFTDAAPSIDPRDTSHPRHALHQQCVAGVQSIDARLGKPWDVHSECMAASLTTLAARSNLDSVDHALLSGQGTRADPGEYVFVVQGQLNDPAQQRAHMPTAEAIATPPEQSFQQLAELDDARSKELARQQTRDQEQVARAPTMHA